MDIFRSPGKGSGAVLLFIHGGYWMFGDKRQFSFPAAAFTCAGITFISLNYSLAPRASIEEQVDQCRRAIEFVHHNALELRADAGNLCVCGHSSGGQLAAMAMATDWPSWQHGLPRAVLRGGLTLSGLHDLEAIRRTESLNSVLKLDAQQAAALSPALLPEQGVPLYAAVGELENAEFQRQTHVLCDSWKAVLRRTMALPGIDHFSILDSLSDAASPLFQMAVEMLSND
jgi:arylformamidase